MSHAVNVALSAMIASYATTEAPVKAVVKVAVKSSPVTPIVTVESTPSDNGSESKVVPTTNPLPKSGTLNAWQFLAIASNANVNWQCESNPARHTTAKFGKDREGMIHAIAAYCGWDPALDFGTQCLAARTKAQQEIGPAMGRKPMMPRPSLTLAGLVAGMPNHRQKSILDLQARERCAVDAGIAFAKVTDLVSFKKAVEAHCDPEMVPMLLNAATEATCKDLAAGLVKDEAGRLADARKGLAAYFG